MPARVYLFLALLPLALVGCHRPHADGPVVVVTAEYPGANARVMAEVVAPALEAQIEGVEGQVRIESVSKSDGTYTGHIYLERGTNPDVALVLVQNRVALSLAGLPEEVRRHDVKVAIGKPSDQTKLLRLAVVDRTGQGWDATSAAAESVRTRLVDAGAFTTAEAFPKAEEQVRLLFDPRKCAQFQLTRQERWKFAPSEAVRPGDDLNKLFVREDLPLSAIATAETFTAPRTCYRLHRSEAVWITGTLPPGNMRTRAAACKELADAEIARAFAGQFGAELFLPR